MKYWDDWVDPEDMEAMWGCTDVYAEWTAAGEKQGEKVHMLRNPDGQPYVTQTEMRAMAETTIKKHFRGKLDPVMICAIAEIESDRQPLAYRFEPKLQEASTGIMQTLQSTAEWLARDMGYTFYTVDWSSSMLYRPFVSVYFGAAYLKWLSTYEGKHRSEEFIVRGYNGGPKGATSKSTERYWNKYLIAKQSLPQKSLHYSDGLGMKPSPFQAGGNTSDAIFSSGKKWFYWDEKASPEDIDELWRHKEVRREWMESGEKEGRVRFARDSQLRPYLTRTELKAVAEITLLRHFRESKLSLGMLCAVAEMCSKRLLYGLDFPSGIFHIALSTAQWLHDTVGYKAYRAHSVEDLSKPFLSTYFAACYVSWLLVYEGRHRSDQFVVQAFLVGPQNINAQNAGPLWSEYLTALTDYQPKRRRQWGCSIL